MDLKTVQKQYEIPESIINQYMSLYHQEDIQEFDLEYMSLMKVLLDMDISEEKIKRFIDTMKNHKTQKGLHILNQERQKILNDIHNKQKYIDKIDVIMKQMEEDNG